MPIDSKKCSNLANDPANTDTVIINLAIRFLYPLKNSVRTWIAGKATYLVVKSTARNAPESSIKSSNCRFWSKFLIWSPWASNVCCWDSSSFVYNWMLESSCCWVTCNDLAKRSASWRCEAISVFRESIVEFKTPIARDSDSISNWLFLLAF